MRAVSSGKVPKGVDRSSIAEVFLGRRRVSLVALVWSGLCMVRPRPRCSGFNIQVIFVVYLCLTGVREVPEPSDTSTAIDCEKIIRIK